MARNERWRQLGDEEVSGVLAAMEGIREQRPPAYSAKKIGGTPAHRRVRRGEPVELPSATVVIHRLVLTSRVGPIVEFDAEVGSGTYMRAIARDVGEALGCGAHLAALRRESIGPFGVHEALKLGNLDGAIPPLGELRELVGHLPAVEVSREERKRIAHGQPIEAQPIGEEPVAILYGGNLVAVAEPRDGLLKPRVVVGP